MEDTKQVIYSVSQLTHCIKNLLESSFLSLCVKGEISNLKVQSSGHAYFTLKDENSQISAVMFRNAHTKLKTPLKVGDKVVVWGQLSVYPPRGGYQIIIQRLQQEGIGELLLKFHELKQRLEKGGYFDAKHKKTLPPFPKVIGVITSPTGSVIQDIIHVLSRRHAGFHLILNPVRVQGDTAKNEIAQAIEEFNRHKLADVLIVGRGGGSLEDLWAFNEIEVAKAIFESKIPIVSAVGHETDFTIADMIADVRAPTPSAAAEIILREKTQLLNSLQTSKAHIQTLAQRQLVGIQDKLKGLLKHLVFKSPETILFPFHQKLDETMRAFDQNLSHQLRIKSQEMLSFKKRLAGLNPLAKVKEQKTSAAKLAKNLNSALLREIQTSQEHLKRLSQKLDASMSTVHQFYKNRLNHTKELLSTIDPKNILKKGYCIPFAENQDSVILSASNVEVGDGLDLLFSDGKIKTKVFEK